MSIFAVERLHDLLLGNSWYRSVEPGCVGFKVYVADPVAARLVMPLSWYGQPVEIVSTNTMERR